MTLFNYKPTKGWGHVTALSKKLAAGSGTFLKTPISPVSFDVHSLELLRQLAEDYSPVLPTLVFAKPPDYGRDTFTMSHAPKDHEHLTYRCHLVHPDGGTWVTDHSRHPVEPMGMSKYLVEPRMMVNPADGAITIDSYSIIDPGPFAYQQDTRHRPSLDRVKPEVRVLSAFDIDERRRSIIDRASGGCVVSGGSPHLGRPDLAMLNAMTTPIESDWSGVNTERDRSANNKPRVTTEARRIKRKLKRKAQHASR